MVTSISGVRDTAQKYSRTTAEAWFEGDSDVKPIQFGTADDPYDLTGHTVTCSYDWVLVDVDEAGDSSEGTLAAGLSNFRNVTDSWADERTLAVTLDDDPTTGRATYTIPTDFYPADAPDLVYDATEEVPAAVLVFSWARSATQTYQFRHILYMRRMDLS